MTKRTVTLTVDADGELLLRPIKAALLSDTGATFEDADVYALALRWMAYGRGPEYMRERLRVELNFCPAECDDGTISRGKARIPCPRCLGYDGDIYVAMQHTNGERAP